LRKRASRRGPRRRFRPSSADQVRGFRGFRRIGRFGGGFIWFCGGDGSRDRVLQLANLREIEPGKLADRQAWLHFSGMDVMLEGTRMREVVHRIFLGRCNIVREIHDGQQPEKADAPVVAAIRFLVPPPPEKPKPRHEPETLRQDKAVISGPKL